MMRAGARDAQLAATRRHAMLRRYDLLLLLPLSFTIRRHRLPSRRYRPPRYAALQRIRALALFR